MSNNINKKKINGCTLGEYIRSIRSSKRWSTQKVAEMANLSSAYVNKIELDKTTNHDINKLKQLASALGINNKIILQYLGYEESPQKTLDENILISYLKSKGYNDNSVSEILSFMSYVMYKQVIMNSQNLPYGIKDAQVECLKQYLFNKPYNQSEFANRLYNPNSNIY